MAAKKSDRELHEAALGYDPGESRVAADEELSLLARMKMWPAPDGIGYTTRPHLEVPAAEFKARCLALTDLLAEYGGDVVVTKRGKPVARLVPFEERPVVDLRGSVLYEAENCWDPMPEVWFPPDGSPPRSPRA